MRVNDSDVIKTYLNTKNISKTVRITGFTRGKVEKILRENNIQKFSFKEVMKKVMNDVEVKTKLKNKASNNETKEKRRVTCLGKYGKDNVLKVKEIKGKRDKTILKNYNVKNISQCDKIKKKKIETCRNNLGVDFPQQSQEIAEKTKNTCLKIYNVPYPSMSDEVKKRVAETNSERYNGHPMHNDEVRNKIIETNLGKYGVKWVLQANSPVRKKVDEIIKEKKLRRLKTYLERLNIKLLDLEYKNNDYLHTWLCLKCNTEFSNTWKNMQQGYLCPVCFPRTTYFSLSEKEILNFIKTTLGPDFQVMENTRSIIYPYEIDIYIPEINLGIEYNGLYWHSDKVIHDKDYHLKKLNLCKEKNIRLIQIFEDEWILKKEIVENRLKYIFNLGNFEKIHARKCVIKNIPNKMKNKFLEDYHIQGSDNSNVFLGAFYNDELVSVMTFSHGSLSRGVKKSKETVWELSRFCTSYKYSIPGIAGKLLRFFQITNNWDEIYTYADRRWSEGELYEKIGFEFCYNTRPNYWYVKNMNRIHRFTLRKKSNEPKDTPEYILRISEGYLRIWDCGNIKFKMINKEHPNESN